MAQFAPLPTAHWLANLSSRVGVGTGDNAVIAGFITRGGPTKRIMIRAVGPSLASSGITDALADPVLDLYDGDGVLITSNDNWHDNANEQEIIDTGLSPESDSESVILLQLPSDDVGVPYTAVLRGANDTTGVGLLEVYDLDSGIGPNIQNISTRGRVDVGESVLIGGTIVLGSNAQDVIVRALGPSLPLMAPWPILRSSYTTGMASCCAAMITGAATNQPRSPLRCSRRPTIRKRLLSQPCARALHRHSPGHGPNHRCRARGNLRPQLAGVYWLTRCSVWAITPPL